MSTSAWRRSWSPEEATYDTIISVDSVTDPDGSKSKTCSSRVVCTLRRAIIEARELSADDRPVEIGKDEASSFCLTNKGEKR